MSWRRAVEAARGLSPGAKLTLLKHAERGRSHYHDDDRNEHGYRREHLASARGVPERTIQRHYRVAERAGYLVLHAGGHRSRQAAWHYTLPGDPWPCPDCETTGKGDIPSAGKGDILTPGKGDILRLERETPTAPITTPGKGDTCDSPISTVTDNPTALPACPSLPHDRNGNDQASQAPNPLVSSLPSLEPGTVSNVRLPEPETQPHQDEADPNWAAPIRCPHGLVNGAVPDPWDHDRPPCPECRAEVEHDRALDVLAAAGIVAEVLSDRRTA